MIAENPKASLTAFAAAIVTVIIFALKHFFAIDTPVEVSAAIGVILIFLFGRFTRITRSEAEDLEENK